MERSSPFSLPPSPFLSLSTSLSTGYMSLYKTTDTSCIVARSDTYTDLGCESKLRACLCSAPPDRATKKAEPLPPLSSFSPTPRLHRQVYAYPYWGSRDFYEHQHVRPFSHCCSLSPILFFSTRQGALIFPQLSSLFFFFFPLRPTTCMSYCSNLGYAYAGVECKSKTPRFEESLPS